MKKIFIYTAALLVGTAFLSSCNKFLDTDMYRYVPDEGAVTDYLTANASLNGVYDALQHFSLYGRYWPVSGDATTTNILLNPRNSNRFIPQLQFSITAANGDVRNYWELAYVTIDRANRLLAAIENITGTDEQKAEIKGQSLALRAMLHFDLVRTFGQTYNGYQSTPGVPYMEKYDENARPPRETVETVYTKIIRDLEEAITLLEIQSPGEAPYKINATSAKALLARVYITQQDYATAKPLLQDIINNSGYRIFTTTEYVAAWSLKYNATANAEFLFALPYSNSDQLATSSLSYMYIRNGYGDFLASDSIMNLYDSTDIRLSTFFIADGALMRVNKYPSRDGLGVTDVPIIRMSDIYLMYAETCAETNDIPTAITYLDEIRQRADPSAGTTTVSGQALLDLIFIERRKEFPYEGIYFYDIKRLKKDLYSGLNMAGIPYRYVAYPSELFALPIPQRELDANPNMTQNPGY